MNHSSLELFLAACGSDEPLRLDVAERDGLRSETWSFRQPFLMIGRRPESDLVLDHWQVSRRHAYLQLIEGRYYCVDLGSRTGTHGGDITERSGWLEQGRAIQIGPYTVRPEWPTPRLRASDTPLGVTWELPGRALGQAIWRMDRHLALVGRSPACKIRIVENDVSKFHCSVVLTPHGVWAIDLLGQKGVFVNDEAVRFARLDDGDVLRIGRHTLRARYDSTPLPLPRTGPPALFPAQPAPASVVLAPDFRIAGSDDDLPAQVMPAGDLDPLAPMPAQGGVIDPSVNLMLQQFGLMQQQMYDQFHHTMLMMFEGFAALHREQSSSIRQEFDQVRRLSQEIEALQIETARLAGVAEARALEPPRPAATSEPTKPVASEPPKSVKNGPAKPTTGGPAKPVTNGPAKPAKNGHSSWGVSPERAAGQKPKGPAERAVQPPPDTEVDIHAQLCLRLATIQTERQNRWQKILGMMTSRA